MALVVQKYGGSSVSDVDAMRRVARRIVATREAGNTVVVVVSAMGDTTDELLDQAAALTGWLESHAQAPAALRRIVRENLDDTLRVARAQAAESQSQQ